MQARAGLAQYLQGQYSPDAAGSGGVLITLPFACLHRLFRLRQYDHEIPGEVSCRAPEHDM